jgi:hypothetical protein
MGWAPMPDRSTPEERAARRQSWEDNHYLEEGRKYTFDVSRHWLTTSNHGRRIYRWTCFIRQTEHPYMIVGCSIDHKTKRKAEKWGEEYLKRGGPPEGFFDPPPPDPREITWKGRDDT